MVRTRRVVECAFGRLKARFPILKDTRLRDPDFVAKLVSVCCAIHKMIEKSDQARAKSAQAKTKKTPAHTVVPDDIFYSSHVVGIHGKQTGETSNNQSFTDGGKKREALAKYVHSVLNVEPALQSKSQKEQKQHMKRVLNGPVGYNKPKTATAELFND